MRISTKQQAVEAAVLLKSQRYNKSRVEDVCHAIQADLLEYFASRKGDRIEYTALEDGKKHYFKVAKRVNEYINPQELKTLAPELYEKLVKTSEYEFVDVR